MPAVYVGRQAIYDRRSRLAAYELLFRSGRHATAGVSEGDRATAAVMLNALTVFGLDRLVDGLRAFINLTRAFIVGEYALPAPDRVVLEVLEDVEVDDELIAALTDLRSRGYRLALDDFVFHPHLRPLVELAEIIKIDVLGVSDADVARHVEALRPYPVRLLAEKVETVEQFEACADLGFELFQGYLLGRPEVVEGKDISGTRLGALRVLEQLHSPGAELSELSSVISQDLAVTYKLMRLVNSAHYGLTRRIETVRDALILLGQETVKRWVTVIVLAQGHDQSPAVIEAALTRARFCELLSSRTALTRGPAGRSFLVGLFSSLDSLLGEPLEKVLEALPLSDDIVAALVYHGGTEGMLLDAVLDYEKQAQDVGDGQHDQPGLEGAEIPEVYLESAAWASDITRLVVAA